MTGHAKIGGVFAKTSKQQGQQFTVHYNVTFQVTVSITGRNVKECQTRLDDKVVDIKQAIFKASDDYIHDE